MKGKAHFFLLCTLIGIAAGWWWTAGRPMPSLPGSANSKAAGLSASGLTPVEQDTVNAAAGLNRGDLPRDANADGAVAATLPGIPETGVISYHDGIMKVAPSVVSLYATSSVGEDSEAGSAGAISQGSGVIVNADGVVLTNLHLIENFDRITVVLSDGRSYPALLIGSDRETDLAVVRIAASNLPYVPLDDAPPLRVGDVVLAIGNPFGVGQTVTQGIVSATHRRVAGGSVWQHFVQIDAAINPGNSGGALINPRGQLVGVNTAVFKGGSGAIGIGFSIPADLLAQVVPQIIEHGSVARGWLGVAVEELSFFPRLASAIGQGAMIKEVLPESPASRGGLKDMDIVTQINGQPVHSATQLLLAISALPPGTPVSLTILRGGVISHSGDGQVIEFDAQELTMTLGTRGS